jgi:hypothetical protein
MALWIGLAQKQNRKGEGTREEKIMSRTESSISKSLPQVMTGFFIAVNASMSYHFTLVFFPC